MKNITLLSVLLIGVCSVHAAEKVTGYFAQAGSYGACYISYNQYDENCKYYVTQDFACRALGEMLFKKGLIYANQLPMYSDSANLNQPPSHCKLTKGLLTGNIGVNPDVNCLAFKQDTGECIGEIY